MSFPTSSIPAILFLNFADALQVTSPKATFCVQIFSWRLHLCSLQLKRTLHCYNFVVLDGESDGRGRLTSRSFSAICSPVWLPRKTTSPSKWIKSSSPPQQSSHTRLQKLVEASACQGDWKEIAKLKVKYSILDLPLPAASCAAAVSFVATLFAGVDLQGSDGRGISQLPICAYTLLFLLNKCSLSQNECL